MRHESSVMGDLLKLSPWDRCDAIVDHHAAGRRVRTLSTKSQLMARLHGQLSGAVSLREIVTTLSSHEARLYHLGAVAPKRRRWRMPTRNGRRARSQPPEDAVQNPPVIDAGDSARFARQERINDRPLGIGTLGAP